MDVSIIIVNYNANKLLSDCLNSVFEQTKEINFEVIVSDNGSSDGSIQMIENDFPQVTLVKNNENLGFGTANNRALKIAKGKYIFFLNNDTILLNNAVKCFFDYFEANGEKENIGALGANLLNKDGQIIHSYGEFENIKKIDDRLSALTHTIYGNLKLFLLDKFRVKSIPKISPQKTFYEKTGNVDYITGADLFLKNNEFAFFDEKFFMYCEELDLQYNMAANGLSRLLITTPRIIHLEGASCKKESNIILQEASFSRINWRMSQIYFYKKHGAPALKIIIWKMLVFMLWLNPAIILRNLKYILKLWKI